MNELYHHGVLGQKWGVRRFQNKDGSLTDAGRDHYHEKRLISTRTRNAAKTKDDVDSIFNSLSAKDRALLDADPNDKEWLSFEAGQYVAKRFLKKIGDEPVAFLDVMDLGGEYTIALATKSGDKYRGKGYASELGRKAVEWLNTNPEVMNKKVKVTWAARTENVASNKVAEKLGFVKDESDSDDKWNMYSLERS